MNTKVVVSVIVTVLILGALASYAVLAPKTTQNASPSPSVISEATPASNLKSLKDLLSMGGSSKCTFSDNVNSNMVEGTTYVSGGKMRGDINSMVGSNHIVSHMIVDGKTSYVWMDGSTTGIKMSLDSVQPSPQGGASATSNQSLDVNKQIDYKCEGWTADSSMFVIPTSVKFTELTLPTGTGTSSGQIDTKSIQCSACDSAPADARAQCRAALNCN